MKHFILQVVLFCGILHSYAQKKNSLGIESTVIMLTSGKSTKMAGFENGFALQAVYRHNTTGNNYVNYAMGFTIGSNRLYDIGFAKIGFEAGDGLGMKNFFVIPAIFVKRFSSESLKRTEWCVGPSLGSGYNFNIKKHLLLRIYDNLEYHIPSKLAGFFINFGVGIHYRF